MSYIIKTENLSYSYTGEEKNNILENINLEIEKGTFTAIIGHNGSGKSTLAKLMCSVLSPTSGEVIIRNGNGEEFSASKEQDSFDIRKTVGMVFQNPDNQLVATVVEEDVAFAPENLGFSPSEIRERVDEALKAAGIYEYRLLDAHKLSGGQKQRVAIAGILAMRPECIIFDESTAMLDPKGREDIMKVILSLKHKYGITVILITHYISEAALADRIIVLDGGKIALDGTPVEVFKRERELVDFGLEIPQCIQLVKRLYEQGCDVNPDILNVNEAVSELSQKLIAGGEENA